MHSSKLLGLQVNLRPIGSGQEYYVMSENLKPSDGGNMGFSASRSRITKFYDVMTSLARSKGFFNFWTFTNKHQDPNWEKSDKEIAKAFRKTLAHLVKNHKRGAAMKGLDQYVWVSEAQRRGNIHFHLVTNTKLVDYNYVRSLWQKYLNQPDASWGFNAQPINKSLDEVNYLPYYFAKYMQKGNGPQKFEPNNLKNRVIHTRSFGYSTGFPILQPIKAEKELFYEALELYLSRSKGLCAENVLYSQKKEFVNRDTGEMHYRTILYCHHEHHEGLRRALSDIEDQPEHALYY
jgi:hypothetical protein